MPIFEKNYKLEKKAKIKRTTNFKKKSEKWIKERNLRKQGCTVNCILVHRERTIFYREKYLQFISLTAILFMFWEIFLMGKIAPGP